MYAIPPPHLEGSTDDRDTTVQIPREHLCYVSPNLQVSPNP